MARTGQIWVDLVALLVSQAGTVCSKAPKQRLLIAHVLVCVNPTVELVNVK